MSAKVVHQVATLMRQWPRASAALVFGVTGTALSILWWSPVIFQTQAVLPFVLFIGTPGVSAAVVGGILGKPLLDPARVRNSINAALRGAAIASLALLLFAPLFATLYVLTQAPHEHWSIPSLTLLMLIGSAFVVWWLVALIGAAVGWALYLMTSYVAR